MAAEPNIDMNGTILIVDDTPENLAVLSDLLSEANYRVLVATDGLSALEQITLLKPDIILLDVMMPGIDGFETCKRLKRNPATTAIPIIFMTGLSELDDLLKGFGEGAVDYIVKPVRPPEVLARVEAQLSQIKTQQRAEQALQQLAFAALTFKRTGLITWLNSAALEVLKTNYPQQPLPIHEETIVETLPHPLLQRVDAALEKANETTIQIGRDFNARILPYKQSDEYLLLIQKRQQNWDLEFLKSAFGLTPREAEILMWISRGKTNKEVGLILETSPRTVNKHLEHIFEKLGVPTRTAAVAKVLNNKRIV